MADRIDISAVAEVIDKASAPIKGIVDAIRGMGEQAKQSNSFFSNIGKTVQSTFKPVSSIFGGVTSSIGNVASKLGSLFGPLQGLTGLTGFGGITAAITSFTQKARDITRTAKAIGISTEALQTFRFAAGNADVADTALNRLRKTLVDLNKGGKATQTTVQLFDKLGISMEQIKQGKLEEILPQIIASFQNITDPMKQAEAGMAIFGKQWNEVRPFILAGTAALDAGAEKFQKWGIGAEQLQKGVEGAKALKELGEVVTNVKDRIAAAVLPAFTPMVQFLSKFIENNQELLKQIALPAFIAAIATAVGSLGVAVAGALGPWGLLAAAIAAAAVAIYQNWDKIEGWFKSQFDGLPDIAKEAVRGIGDHFSRLWTNIKEGWKEGGLVGAAKGYWKTQMESLSGIADWVKGKFDEINWSDIGSKASTAMGNAWRSAGTWISETWERLQTAVEQIDWSKVGEWIGRALGEAMLFPFKATFKVGEWLAELPWGDIGKTAGQLLIDSFKLVFWDLPAWGADLAVKLGEALGKVDWGEVSRSINLFFGNLVLDMLRIGGELLEGLAKGMLNAIPNWMGNVASSIKSAIGNIELPLIGRLGGAKPTPAANDNLLARQSAAGLAGGGLPDINTNITMNNVPQGVTATATTTAGGRRTDTNVGASTFPAAVG